MALGPIEVIEIAFPGNQFNGEIMPELQRLIDNDTISVIDGLFLLKDDDGDVTFVEFDELGANHDAARLAEFMDQLDALISDDDVDALAAGIAPGSSAALLVFEHTWAKPFRDAVVASGGLLAANFRVPGAIVDELLDELSAVADG
jgi:hypothetical protein